MTVKYTQINGSKSEYVHDVISIHQLSTHGYEIYQAGRSNRLVIKDVDELKIDQRCLCHHR